MTASKQSLLSHGYAILSLASSMRRRQGVYTEDDARVRELFMGLFKSFENSAKQDGYAAEDIKDALYALTAYSDETLGSIQWGGRDSFLQQPLTRLLFGEAGFGNRFFDLLTGLRRKAEQRREVIEVYFACMVLGFMGKYIVEGDLARRAVLDELAGEILSRNPEPSELSPCGKSPDEVQVRVRGLRLWLVTAVALGALLIMFGVFKFFASRDAAQAARQLQSERDTVVRTIGQ